MTTLSFFRVRSRTDAVEFVRRVREFVPGGVMRVRTPSGNVLVVKCGDDEHLWTRGIITSSGFYTRPEEKIDDPVGWVYANRRMVNKWLRHLESGCTPDTVAE